MPALGIAGWCWLVGRLRRIADIHADDEGVAIAGMLQADDRNPKRFSEIREGVTPPPEIGPAGTVGAKFLCVARTFFLRSAYQKAFNA